MPINFLDLPRELRDAIYEHTLVLNNEPIVFPCGRYYKEPPIAIGLLGTCKTVQEEASSVLFGINYFQGTSSIRDEDFALFLEQIGRLNAGNLQHLNIRFPLFDVKDMRIITVHAQSLRLLKTIQSLCTRLKTITTTLASIVDLNTLFDYLEEPKSISEALEMIDVHFKAIPSLLEVVIEVYGIAPGKFAREEIVRHGWTLSTKEYNIYGHPSDM